MNLRNLVLFCVVLLTSPLFMQGMEISEGSALKKQRLTGDFSETSPSLIQNPTLDNLKELALSMNLFTTAMGGNGYWHLYDTEQKFADIPLMTTTEATTATFKGYRHNVKLDKSLTKLITNATANVAIVENRHKLAENYKIHLMPEQHNIVSTVYKLLTHVQQDDELKTLINTIKFAQEQSGKLTIGPDIPYIVIYPASGKENAQNLLNKIYALFKDAEGINNTPRFNVPVTSLIYIAQGEGNDKEIKEYASLFEAPDKIYYHPEFEGSYHDYHLSHPECSHIKLSTQKLSESSE